MDQGLFANLHAYVQINAALAPIAERLQLKRLVPMAVDQAIVEIITPVVERSVTIACMTAQELIVKVHASSDDCYPIFDTCYKTWFCFVSNLCDLSLAV